MQVEVKFEVKFQQQSLAVKVIGMTLKRLTVVYYL